MNLISNNGKYSGISFYRRFIAFSLLVPVSLGMAAVCPCLDNAFADTNDMSSITIHSDNDGANYDAYLLFNAVIDDNNNASNERYNESLDYNGLIDFLNDNGYQEWLDSNGYNDDNEAYMSIRFISEKIADSSGHGDPAVVDSDSFAMRLSKWVASSSGIEPTKIQSDDSGNAVLNGDSGYYLIVSDNGDSGIDATSPIWAVVGGASDTVEVKSDSPRITKNINDGGSAASLADKSIGDEVSYSVKVVLPSNFNSYDDYYFNVTDNIPAGFLINEDDVRVSVNGSDITDGFNISIDDNNKLTVESDDIRTIVKADGEPLNSGDTIAIDYKVNLFDASLLVYGGEGNINSASFTYPSDPMSDKQGTIYSDKTWVFTYNLSIFKTDADDGEPLANAGFTLSRDSDGKYLSIKDDNGLSSLEWVESKEAANVFQTDSAGKIGFMGLDAGTYTITETSAPEGYEVPSGDSGSFKVEITPSYDAINGELDSITATVSGGAALSPSISQDDIIVDDGSISVHIVNDSDEGDIFNMISNLPKTWDGMSPLLKTTAITTIVALIVLIIAIIVKKRSNDKEEERC